MSFVSSFYFYIAKLLYYGTMYFNCHESRSGDGILEKSIFFLYLSIDSTMYPPISQEAFILSVSKGSAMIYMLGLSPKSSIVVSKQRLIGEVITMSTLVDFIFCFTSLHCWTPNSEMDESIKLPDFLKLWYSELICMFCPGFLTFISDAAWLCLD